MTCWRVEVGLGPCGEGDTVLLSIPDIRQQKDFDCGCAAIESVCRFLGMRAGRSVAKLANPIQGMSPDTLEAALRSMRFSLVIGNMRVSDLKHFTREYMPVICPVADFGGHWVVVRGVERSRVHVQCPERGPVAVPIDDWETGWTSGTRHGVDYERWGIAVG